MRAKKSNNTRHNHETPLPRLIVPQMSPRAAAARQRAIALLSQGVLSPYPDYRNMKNTVRGSWTGR
ncbi:hypothetical protein AMST5_03600 [freshwater sediment metagenome]|uniref:Uncharacterized protein n=1 Tax=freshwater sediment metagenome TaxID=556182 RepID=A0AA48M6P0_9ZZZZ